MTRVNVTHEGVRYECELEEHAGIDRYEVRIERPDNGRRYYVLLGPEITDTVVSMQTRNGSWRTVTPETAHWQFTGLRTIARHTLDHHLRLKREAKK